MKVKISGYVKKVEDTHFIMWMNNHEQIKAIVKNFGETTYSPLREYQCIKIWKGKFYDDILKSGMTPSEVLLSLEDVCIECNIKKSKVAVNVTAINFVFDNFEV